MDPIRVRFEANVEAMDYWCRRIGKPLGRTASKDLELTYSRAHRWLLAWKTKLVQDYGFLEEDTNIRMLFSIRKDDLHLQLPAHVYTFFSPNRQRQWETIFHSNVFCRPRHAFKPLNNILDLLQCLLPGVIVLVMEEVIPGAKKCITTRGLPPLLWMQEYSAMLEDIFGYKGYDKLELAASSDDLAYTVEFRPGNAPY